MSIRVQCLICQRVYNVSDESAGKKGRCKACGAVLTIPPRGFSPHSPAEPESAALEEAEPPPADPYAQEPSEPPAMEPQAPDAPADPFAGLGGGEPIPFATAAPKPPPLPVMGQTYAPPPAHFSRQFIAPPIRQSRAGMWVAVGIVSAIIVLVAAGFIVRRVKNPAMGMSEAQILAKLHGRWNIVSSRGNVHIIKNDMTFNSDFTFHQEHKSATGVSDFTGTYTLSGRKLDLIVTHVRIGKSSFVGTRFPAGLIREVSDTKLVFDTGGGDEVYRRAP